MSTREQRARLIGNRIHLRCTAKTDHEQTVRGREREKRKTSGEREGNQNLGAKRSQFKHKRRLQFCNAGLLVQNPLLVLYYFHICSQRKTGTRTDGHLDESAPRDAQTDRRASTNAHAILDGSAQTALQTGACRHTAAAAATSLCACPFRNETSQPARRRTAEQSHRRTDKLVEGIRLDTLTDSQIAPCSLCLDISRSFFPSPSVSLARSLDFACWLAGWLALSALASCIQLMPARRCLLAATAAISRSLTLCKLNRSKQSDKL